MESKIKEDAGSVTAELTVVANMTDNGVKYKCEAKNKAISTPLVETVSFQVFCKSICLCLLTLKA